MVIVAIGAEGFPSSLPFGSVTNSGYANHDERRETSGG